MDGPYVLASVALFDDAGTLLDHQHAAHTTAAYRYLQFKEAFEVYLPAVLKRSGG